MSDPSAAARERLAVLVRRLRAYAGRGGDQDRTWAAVRGVVVELAAIGAPGRPLPDVARHAWPDVVTVLANDALDVPGRVSDVERLVEQALDATR